MFFYNVNSFPCSLPYIFKILNNDIKVLKVHPTAFTLYVDDLLYPPFSDNLL